MAVSKVWVGIERCAHKAPLLFPQTLEQLFHSTDVLYKQSLYVGYNFQL